MSDLSKKKCKPCEGIGRKLSEDEVVGHCHQLDGWKFNKKDQIIEKCFKFKDYYEVMAFVNAVAWVSHCEDHHPELVVNYDNCLVRYSTHALGGLTENDFICASKVSDLIG